MQPDNPAETEATAESVPSAVEQGEGQAPNSVAEPDPPDAESTESQRRTENQMPDPSALVAMAAMHMQTADLIHVLVTVFDAHAWRSMGLVADHTGEARKDLPSAQISIDCLAFCLSKIEGTLEDGEKRDVQRRLTDLRMNYVAKAREG